MNLTQNYTKLEKDHKAREEEEARLTNMMAIVMWKWLPALSMCSHVWSVEDGEKDG